MTGLALWSSHAIGTKGPWPALLSELLGAQYPLHGPGIPGGRSQGWGGRPLDRRPPESSASLSCHLPLQPSGTRAREWLCLTGLVGPGAGGGWNESPCLPSPGGGRRASREAPVPPTVHCFASAVMLRAEGGWPPASTSRETSQELPPRQAGLAQGLTSQGAGASVWGQLARSPDTAVEPPVEQALGFPAHSTRDPARGQPRGSLPAARPSVPAQRLGRAALHVPSFQSPIARRPVPPKGEHLRLKEFAAAVTGLRDVAGALRAGMGTAGGARGRWVSGGRGAPEDRPGHLLRL